LRIKWCQGGDAPELVGLCDSPHDQNREISIHQLLDLQTGMGLIPHRYMFLIVVRDGFMLRGKTELKFPSESLIMRHFTTVPG
jgi:hypothetical protein